MRGVPSVLMVGLMVAGSGWWTLGHAEAHVLVPLDAALPAGLDGLSAVSDGQVIYAFGGYGDEVGLSDAIVRIDPAQGLVETMAARLPTPRVWTSAVWDGHVAYVFGGAVDAGEEWENTDEVVRYDPVADAVEVLAVHLPTPRASTAAAWDGQRAYVFGGSPGVGQLLDEVVRFDPLSGVEVLEVKLPSPRDGLAAAAAGGAIHLFGGNLGEGQRSDQVLRFSSGTGALADTGARLPQPLGGLSAAVGSGDVLLFGGAVDAFTSSDAVLRFEPSTGTVSDLGAPLPRARANTAAAWAGSAPHVLGGRLSGDGAFLDEVLTLAPLPQPPRDLTASAGPEVGQVELRWDPDPEHDALDGVTTYRVYRGTAPDELALLAEVPTGTDSYIDQGLDLLSTYYYRLRAVGPMGEGPASNDACTAPWPAHLLPSTAEPCSPPPGWSEDVLAEEELGEVQRATVVVDGSPADDPRFYELSVDAGLGEPVILTFFTAGVPVPPVHHELQPVGADRLRVVARADPGVGLCVAALNQQCMAGLPLDPLDTGWLLREGPKAAVIVEVGDTFLQVPFAGQLLR